MLGYWLKKTQIYQRYKLARTIGYGLYIVNIFFLRVLRINGSCRYCKHFTSSVLCSNNLHIENDSFSVLRSLAGSANCYIQASNGIYVGKDTIWSVNVSLVSLNHDLYDYSKSVKSGPIIIGRQCWLGAGVVILPGVILGEHTIVGANSVVTSSFEEGHQVLSGAPARMMRRLSKCAE